MTHNSRLKKTENLPSYNDVTPYIINVIDKFKEKLIIKVQNIPYCKLQGYEKFVHPDINNIGELENEDGTRFSIVNALAFDRIKNGNCKKCIYSFLCSGYI